MVGEKLKVLHVIPSVGPARGGPSAAIRALTRSLVEGGCDVDVVTTDDNGRHRLDVSLNEEVIEQGVCYRYFRRQIYFYTVSLPLARWVKKHVSDYDVVHVHALFSFAPAAAGRHARRHAIPYVVRPLGTLGAWGMRQKGFLKKVSYGLIERNLLRHASAVHFTSHTEADAARNYVPPGRSVIVPNPVEPPRTAQMDGNLLRSRYPQLSDQLLLIFLSRLDPKKGLDLLLPAVAQLQNRIPDMALVVAGAGSVSYETWVRAEVTRLGIDDRVVMLGEVAGGDKWSVLASGDVFVLPSREENFGIAVAEAMSIGLPVVVGSGVAIARDIEAAGAGLVTNYDVADLAAKLHTLGSDQSLRRRMGSEGRSLVHRKFSPSGVSSQLIQLYQRLTR